MSTHDYGNELERIAKRCLEREGYRVYQVRRSPIKRPDGSWFSPSVDIGGGDLVAWKQGERLRVIQVTASSGISERVTTFLEAGWPMEHVRTELWLDQSVSAGLGVSKAEWAYSRHFRVRWSDDEFALDKERLVWFDGAPATLPAKQLNIGRKFT